MAIRGIVGKIPSEGDFVRRNLSEPLTRAFARWLASVAEEEAAWGVPGAAEPLRFVFADHAEGGAMVGVVAPSRDSVGRVFPLALFEWTPCHPEGPHLAALPIAYQAFLDGAYALAGAVGERTTAELEAELEALPRVGPEEHAKASSLCERTLDDTSAASFEARIFDEPATERFYAYHTLLTAIAILARGAAFGAPPTLDCPIETDVDLFVWLELLRRSLPRGVKVPTVLWSEDDPPRLAIVLGEPSPADYRFRTDRGGSDRIWPLKTESARAREDAFTRLAALAPTSQGALRDLVEGVVSAGRAYGVGERS